MQRRSNIHISSLIVFFSILTTILQFVSYYFFASPYIVLGAASLVVVLCCHVLLERSASYETCFTYTTLNVFISLVITVLIYLEKADFTLLPYTGTLIGLICVNWLIPTIHCFLRDMLDYGIRVEDFKLFFRNNSILFLIFYLAVIIYGSFFTDAFSWAYQGSAPSVNLTPFLMISAQIEEHLDGTLPLKSILIYLGSRILLFTPFGFYCTLISRKVSRLLRLVFLLLFPAILEALQYFFYPSRCDIDDIIYGFIGGLLGWLLFFLTNLIFRLVSGKDFLERDSGYHFSNSSLHF